ncbi:hypothetical protein SAY86_028658 [Trapa natans]|uniref:Uncharacterized protein n=1 Tax=Trapa natans TaxID=22666 RepID=A0AAN7M1S4_TRANT|nr:hypothetical protein SAY86_028658 [Trapa natans]
MNPTNEPPLPQLQPPQPPQPHRPSTSCDRHPDEHFTGFCPSCLCERLVVLESSSICAASSSSSFRKPPAAAVAAIKAIFKPSAAAAAPSSSSSSYLSELRRTKSFSASKNEGLFSGIFEPQRKSCDVRARSTLWNLFTLDDGTKSPGAEQRNLASTSIQPHPALESKEVFAEIEAVKPDIGEESEEEKDEIRAFEEARRSNVVAEIVEEEGVRKEPGELVAEDLRTMKDHMDLDSNHKKPPSGRDFKDIAGSFWSAASVFSKKLQKWRKKQKLKRQREAGGGGGYSSTLPVEKPIGRQFRETQSEIADYGFGRRSCDTDPRFSLDAGRISFDDPRYSFDEPRASWDGYLVGRSFPPARMGPTMVSVVEDSPPTVHHVPRTDTQIPVEEPPMINSLEEEDDGVPGGSAQTRDYYLDSSARRRKSLDRSSSIRKTAAAVVAEMDELKSVKNAKVSPVTMEYFQGSKSLVGERELRDSRDSTLNSLGDDYSDMFEIGFADGVSVMANGDRKGPKKSSRWKAWSIWGFIHRKGGNKDENYDRFSSRGNGVERSFSESWKDRNGGPRLAADRRVLRSNSSVNSRNSYSLGGSFGRKSGMDMNGHSRKRRDEFFLERNRSARYSPKNVDNGLLRFYLTPMRGSRRGVGGGSIGVGLGKGRAGPTQFIAHSMLRL